MYVCSDVFYKKMGSLMAGWNTPSLDPKTARLRRNRSLVKEEIESYWRSKKKSEEELFRAVDTPSDGCFDEKRRNRNMHDQALFLRLILTRVAQHFRLRRTWKN